MVEHSLTGLLGQRVFRLVLGYEDLVDHADLRRAPLPGVVLGKPIRDAGGPKLLA